MRAALFSLPHVVCQGETIVFKIRELAYKLILHMSEMRYMFTEHDKAGLSLLGKWGSLWWDKKEEMEISPDMNLLLYLCLHAVLLV